MDELLKRVRAYLLRRLVALVDRAGLLEEATNDTITDILQNGFTPEDEAIMDAAAGLPPSSPPPA